MLNTNNISLILLRFHRLPVPRTNIYLFSCCFHCSYFHPLAHSTPRYVPQSTIDEAAKSERKNDFIICVEMKKENKIKSLSPENKETQSNNSKDRNIYLWFYFFARSE